MTSNKEIKAEAQRFREWWERNRLNPCGISFKAVAEWSLMKEQKARQGVLEEVRRKIEGAYHDRNDYPPFEIVSFHDRPKYHRYILMLIAELKTKTSEAKYPKEKELKK